VYDDPRLGDKAPFITGEIIGVDGGKMA